MCGFGPAPILLPEGQSVQQRPPPPVAAPDPAYATVWDTNAAALSQVIDLASALWSIPCVGEQRFQQAMKEGDSAAADFLVRFLSGRLRFGAPARVWNDIMDALDKDGLNTLKEHLQSSRECSDSKCLSRTAISYESYRKLVRFQLQGLPGIEGKGVGGECSRCLFAPKLFFFFCEFWLAKFSCSC